jgi:hypothetical protein
MFTQVVTPDPFGPKAEEGMCLQYVRQAYGLPLRYGSATEAWQKSPTQHRDRDYPQGVWFPVWWALDKNVNGHVALVAPDGRVYSTSNLNPNPLKVHPNVADVEAYYARYGMTLTYRGWTEDVAGYPVIASSGIANQGTITTSEDDELITAETQKWFKENFMTKADGAYQNERMFTKSDGAYMNNSRDDQFAALMSALDGKLDKLDGNYIVNLLKAVKPGANDPKAVADAIAGIIPEAIAKEVADELAARLGGK